MSRRPKLKGKILFVFSDPGGAKPCLSLMTECCNGENIALTDRVYSFYKDFEVEPLIIKGINELKESVLVSTIQPDLIFTGTSYTSDIEKRFIRYAKEKRIPCWSFVDHWTSISDRFRDEQNTLQLPDKIWVIDQTAKAIAIDEGIDSDKLVISGNPYQDWLRNWKPSISRSKFFDKIGVGVHKKIILFAPDPLSNVDGKAKYGFDEYTSSEKLVNAIKCSPPELIKNWVVLIKAHPNQNIDQLQRIFKEQANCQMLPKDIDANECIYFSQVIVGFFSSFLQEGAIMNKPIIRFLEKKLDNDPFQDLSIGIIVNEQELIQEISRTMNMKKDIFLGGERIHLRALNEQDIKANYAHWLNDSEITVFNSHGRFPMTVEKLLKYVQSSQTSTTDLVLAIIDKETNSHIGNISLQNISWIDRSAEIAFLLGEKSYWGKGVMQEAASMLLNHGFKLLNLHRIYCGTSADNIGMQKLAEKIGMKKEGVRRDALFKNGKYTDIIEYGLLSTEI